MRVDDQYCNFECPKGKERLNKVLNSCESVFDAVADMRLFIKTCKETCPIYGTKIEEQVEVISESP